MELTVLGFLVLAYIAGSIPSSYLAGRMNGVDLRQHGSGNLGATNVYRVLGARAAIPVMLADIGKGFVPVAFFPGWDGSADGRLAIAYGCAAIAGHVWSAFLRFKGGKGVATGAGVLFALVPLATVLALLIWIGIVALTRYVSVGSILTATFVPILAFVFDASGAVVAFCAVVALFVWWTHRENVRRLLEGTEHRFGSNRHRAREGRDEAAERGADE